MLVCFKIISVYSLTLKDYQCLYIIIMLHIDLFASRKYIANAMLYFVMEHPATIYIAKLYYAINCYVITYFFNFNYKCSCK
jgi:hypothetical protein